MIIIGETRETDNDDNFPSITELINKPMKDKDKIIDYMKKCDVIAVAPGTLIDVIDNSTRISKVALMTDGKYEWRSDLIYYVEKYDMELPAEFIQHVLSHR